MWWHWMALHNEKKINKIEFKILITFFLLLYICLMTFALEAWTLVDQLWLSSASGSGVLLNFGTLLIHYNGREGGDRGGGGGGVFRDGGGEEKMTEEDEEEGFLTDRSGGKVAHSWGMYKCLFYIKRWDVLRRGRRKVSSKHCRISVQSSQINIDGLFPFPPFFFLAQA